VAVLQTPYHSFTLVYVIFNSFIYVIRSSVNVNFCIKGVAVLQSTTHFFTSVFVTFHYYIYVVGSSVNLFFVGTYFNLHPTQLRLGFLSTILLCIFPILYYYIYFFVYFYVSIIAYYFNYCCICAVTRLYIVICFLAVLR
jgi:hypothetical protein